MNKQQKGFTAVEALLIILILAIVGFGGYYVWNTNYRNIATTNPYAGWRSYTLTNEKATFKYPPSWTLINDQSGSNYATDTDQVELDAPNGFSITIAVQDSQGQGTDVADVSSSPITFLGKSDYLIFGSYPDANGQLSSKIGVVGLSTSPNNLELSPPAKNNITNSQSYTNEAFFAVSMNFPGTGDNIGIQPGAVSSNADIKTGKLIIESMAY